MKTIKKVILLLAFAGIVLTGGCNKNDTDLSQLLLIKINYTNSEFEGGKLYGFNVTPADTIPLEIEYVKPGDFGYIKITHKPDLEVIFEGDIIWRGVGEIQIPEKFSDPAEFLKADYEIEAPSLENFEYFFLKKPLSGTFATHGNVDLELKLEEDFDKIWEELADLQVIHEFMDDNASMGIFLYPASALTWDFAKWLFVFYK